MLGRVSIRHPQAKPLSIALLNSVYVGSITTRNIGTIELIRNTSRLCVFGVELISKANKSDAFFSNKTIFQYTTRKWINEIWPHKDYKYVR